MRLEIRDIESSMVYDIGRDGAVLGRERAKTDISLRDESISKRHARIFLESDGWFLEDLNSSNGTYLDDQRITAPVPLMQGVMFSLAQRKFEVVFIDGASASSSANGAVDDYPPAGMGEDSIGGPSFADSPPAFEDNMHSEMGGGGDEEMPEGKGVGYFLVAVPKAVGYYMAHVPLMAVNPLGVIRKGAEDQKLEAKGQMEIAAYAIPGAILGSLVGAICSFIALLINGMFNFGGLIAALPVAAISGAIAGVFGYFAHPITRWIVEKLKGESTPRSRTNYFIGFFTLGILTAVPQGIAQIVAALPIPFVNLLGPLLMTLVSLISVYFAYTWVKAFNLVKWTQYVVLALGILSVVGASIGFVSGLYSTIMVLVEGGELPTGGGMAAGGDTGEVDLDDIELTDEQKAALDAMPEEQRAATEEAWKRALAVTKAAAAQTGDAQKAVEDATKAAADAAENAGDAAEDAADAAGDAAENAGDAAEDATEAATKAADDAAAAAKAAAAKAAAARAPPPPPPPTRAPPPPVRAPPPPRAPAVAAGSINTAEHPLGITPFVAYLQKRDAVERAVSDKPELLKNRKILREYEALWDKTYAIRKKYARKKGDRFKKDKIYSRQKGQEIFEKTGRHVDALYGMIFN